MDELRLQLESLGDVDLLLSALEAVGGSPCQPFWSRALAALQEGDVDALSFAAGVLVDVTWEKLHTGYWMDVDVAWRDAYTLAVLLLTAAQLHAFQQQQQPQPVHQHQQQQQQQSHVLQHHHHEQQLPPLQQAQPEQQCLHHNTSIAPMASHVARAAAGPDITLQGQHQQQLEAIAAAVPAPSATSAASLMRQLDMAAIMGGPRFRALLDKSIASVEQQLQGWQEGQAQQQQQQHQQPQQQQEEGQLTTETCTLKRPAIPAQAQVTSSKRACVAAEGMNGQAACAGACVWHQVQLPPGSLTSASDCVPVEHLPPLEVFLMQYMGCGNAGDGRPCIITGALDHWPALQRWQDPQYLCRLAGLRTVPVEVGSHYMAEGWGQEMMTLGNFIQRHIVTTPPQGQLQHQQQHQAQQQQQQQQEDRQAGADRQQQQQQQPPPQQQQQQPPPPPPQQQHEQQQQQPLAYLAQHPLFDQVPALRADICTPDYCTLGEGDLKAVNAWFGPGGTVTPLHQDPHHNILAQVVGRKYVRLYHPAHAPKLYPYPDGMHTNTSQVDLEAPDAAQFPEFGSAPYQDVVLEAGQALYIPPRWWHFVKALSTSFSVSFWWA